MERAQKGGAVVVAGQVAPGGDFAADVGEEAAAREGEDGVAEDGGETLVFGVEFVGDAGVERRACGGVVGVCVYVGGDVGGLGVGEVAGDVVDDFGVCGEVGLDEAEEGAFVFLVADDYGDVSVGAFADGLFGGEGEEGRLWVGAGKVGKIDAAVREDAGGAVDCVQEGLVGKSAEACKRVGGRGATGCVDDGVVDVLCFRI